jgi:hypothetical protein
MYENKNVSRINDKTCLYPPLCRDPQRVKLFNHVLREIRSCVDLSAGVSRALRENGRAAAVLAIGSGPFTSTSGVWKPDGTRIVSRACRLIWINPWLGSQRELCAAQARQFILRRRLSSSFRAAVAIVLHDTPHLVRLFHITPSLYHDKDRLRS